MDAGFARYARLCAALGVIAIIVGIRLTRNQATVALAGPASFQESRNAPNNILSLSGASNSVAAVSKSTNSQGAIVLGNGTINQKQVGLNFIGTNNVTVMMPSSVASIDLNRPPASLYDEAVRIYKSDAGLALYPEALQYGIAAVQKNFTPAFTLLGLWNWCGDVVPRNTNEAKRLWAIGAARNSAEANYFLGLSDLDRDFRAMGGIKDPNGFTNPDGLDGVRQAQRTYDSVRGLQYLLKASKGGYKKASERIVEEWRAARFWGRETAAPFKILAKKHPDEFDELLNVVLAGLKVKVPSEYEELLKAKRDGVRFDE